MRNRTAAAIAGLCLAVGGLGITGLLATGCSNEDGNGEVSRESGAPTTATPSTPTTPPTTVTTPPDDPNNDAFDDADADADAPGVIGTLSTETRQSSGFLGAGQPTAQLVDVRQASQSGFQRVVLEFAGDTAPQYRIGYQTPPVRQPGSGFPVDIPGAAALQIHAEPASQVDMSQPNFPLTYSGPQRISMQGPGPATDLIFVGDFESNLYWAIGLTLPAPFAVGVLANPTRLVVDIATD